MKLRLGLLLTLIASLLALTVPLHAQDDDMAAVIEEAMAALLAAEDYTSYNATTYTSQTASIEVFIEGESALVQNGVDATEDVTTFVADGGLGNVVTTTSATSIDSQNGTETQYTLLAETRVVDGVIYVNAAYDGEATAEAIPDGWTEVTAEALETYPGLSRLGLETLLTAQESEEQIPFTNNYEAIAEAVTTGSTLATGSADAATTDGRTGYGYTIILSVDGIKQFLAATPNIESNPVLGAMLDNLGEASTGFFSIIVDDEGYLLEASVTLSVAVEGLDVSAIDPNVPAGTTANIGLILSSIVDVTDINADLPLAEVPAE